MKTYGGQYLSSDDLHMLGIGSVGKNVLVHSTCILVGLENIHFGNYIRVDPFCLLLAAAGSIRIGNHNHIAASAFLSGSHGLELADFVGISRNVSIYTTNDDYTGGGLTGPTIPAKYLRVTKGAVHVGRHVVVGAGTIVLPGVSIGEGATIGALSLVKSNLEPWAIYAGVPVRRIGDRKKDLLSLEAQLIREESQGD